MKIRIGIPKGFYYYKYFPLWKTFFTELGYEVITSSDTNKEIFENALLICEDDLCLPTKIFLAHVKELIDKGVDFLFLPQIASTHKNRWTCPKIIASTILVKNIFSDLPIVIDPYINFVFFKANPYKYLKLASMSLGKMLKIDNYKIKQAFFCSFKKQKLFDEILIREKKYTIDGNLSLDKNLQENKGSLKIGLIGHPYVIYDNYISLNMIDRIRKMNIEIVTPENFPFQLKKKLCSNVDIYQEMYWTIGEELIGSALLYSQDTSIDGIIYMCVFGCGLDSIIEEIVSREIKNRGNKPYMKIILDEHLSEVNFLTKLMAFFDMVKWKKERKFFISIE